MASVNNSLTKELLIFLSSQEEGVTDGKLAEHFGNRHKFLVPIINDLLRSHRIQLFTDGSNATVYKAIKEETASRLEGLGRDQVIIFQVIEKAGNK